MKPASLRIEALESRIAPAVYFLSGASNAVVDSGGTDVNDAADAAAVGATVAVKLVKGDSLVLDTNGNHILDTGEVTYAKVTGGQATIFATELNSNVGFSANEITGLAVSNGFKATITGDVRGDIATVLDGSGALTGAVLQHASIASLKITGRVTGSIYAGAAISNVNIGSDTINTGVSAQTIATGTAAGGNNFSFNGGSSLTLLDFAFVGQGEKGGDIKNVTLAHGAANVRAGNGGDSTGAEAGAGGNIVNLTFLDTKNAFQIYAGNGGKAATGKGGAGGKISGLTLSCSGSPTAASYITAGDGGDGNIGGAGGSLKGHTVNFSADNDNYVYFQGGDGGDGLSGTPKSQGGNGGTTSNVTFTSTALVDFVGIYGGDGGNAGSGSNGKGGNGGTMSKITYSALGGNYGPYFGAGDGGDGEGKGSGGAGGDVLKTSASVGDTDSNSDIYGGDGGQGGTSGFGGRGGNVIKFNHSCKDDPGNDTTEYLWTYGGDGGDGGKGGGRGGDSKNGRMTGGDGSTGFYIYGGDGGSGTASNAKGGNGGNITNVLVDVGASKDESQFFAGDGGDGNDANAGNGGSIINVQMTQDGAMSNLFQFSTGEGGNVSTGNGKGGNGGAFINSSFTKTGGNALPNSADLEIYTGGGGNGHGTGNGGNGGAMTGFKLNLQQDVDELHFYTGSGGEAGADGKLGGDGGAMKGTKFTMAGVFGSVPNIRAGNGGSANGAGAKGGDSGIISGFTADAPLASILINDGVRGGSGGGSDAQSKGGKGGDVSGVKGSFGTLSIFGADGGSAAGTGGHGGSIKGLNVTAITNFVRLIKAGDGGDGAVTAGAGGSVVNAKVAGDIGDFTSVFGVSSDPGNMGGLIAGRGGFFGPGSGTLDPTKNGSILGVHAMRIAAILAGAPSADNLTADNAVKKISGITGVTAIGADLAPPGFSFTDNAGGPNPSNGVFLLGDGDTALDGLVIVSAGGFTGPHPAPLKLIEV